MVESGLSFDILIKPRHIAHAVEFVRRNPDLMVVVDHMAKPEVRNSGFEPWRCEMEAFRALKHVHCKISGILTEDGEGWTLDRIRPYVDAVIDIFGPDRLIFGSDWPVVNLVADYDRWVDAVDALLSNLTRADQQKSGPTTGNVSIGSEGSPQREVNIGRRVVDVLTGAEHGPVLDERPRCGKPHCARRYGFWRSSSVE
jgi:L-fuconolactonase